jgi:hypothetical protein
MENVELMTVPLETESLKRFKAAAKEVTASSTTSRTDALMALCDAGILKKSKKTGKYSRRTC